VRERYPSMRRKGTGCYPDVALPLAAQVGG